jgi:hypothetical protein
VSVGKPSLDKVAGRFEEGPFARSEEGGPCSFTHLRDHGPDRPRTCLEGNGVTVSEVNGTGRPPFRVRPYMFREGVTMQSQPVDNRWTDSLPRPTAATNCRRDGAKARLDPVPEQKKLGDASRRPHGPTDWSRARLEPAAALAGQEEPLVAVVNVPGVGCAQRVPVGHVAEAEP